MSNHRSLFGVSIFLISVLSFGTTQCRQIEPEDTASQKERLRITTTEIDLFLMTRKWFASSLDYGKHSYFKDSSQTGIRIPLNGIPNLFLYAFKSYAAPTKMRVYLTQVYTFSWSDADSFNGHILYLDFEDFRVYRADYEKGEAVRQEVIRDLAYMRLNYEYSQDPENTPEPSGDVPGLKVAISQSCKLAGGYKVVPLNSEFSLVEIKGEADCLFSYDPCRTQPAKYRPVPKWGIGYANASVVAPFGPEWKNAEYNANETPLFDDNRFSQILFWYFSYTTYGPIGVIATP